jgi:hypothetical protein
MEQHETHVGTLYRLTLDTGAQHLLSPQQLQGIDPATIVAQERFEQAHWRRDINDVDRLLALDAEGRWRTLEAVADDHWEDAAQPMAYSGEERQEAREQTETVGRSFMDRVHDLSERLQGWVRSLGQDRSQGME